MRVKRIKIWNFKSFKESEVELKNFNVLIGRNASGKSSFLELLSLVRASVIDEGFLYAGDFNVGKIAFQPNKVIEVDLVFHREPEDFWAKVILSDFGIKLSFSEDSFKEKFLDFCRSIIYIRSPSFLNKKKIPWSSEVLSGFPSSIGKELPQVLLNLAAEKGSFPEKVKEILSYMFPEIKIGLDFNPSGELVLRVEERERVIPEEMIPSGFYKILTILTALECNPRLLLIDEIENSLFYENLEILVDELKAFSRKTDSTVILSTNSPVVLDVIHPEDLIIVEKTEEGSVLRRLENPEELKNKLSELGITLSDKVLYGDIFLSGGSSCL